MNCLKIGLCGFILLCNDAVQAMNINSARVAKLPTIQMHEPEQANDQALLENTFLIAAYTGNVALVSTCIAHGVNVNAHNDEGPTALILASYAGHGAVVRILLAQPTTNINIRCTGWTALMNAANFRHQHILRALLKHRNAAHQFDVDLAGCEILIALNALDRSTKRLLKHHIIFRRGIEELSHELQ